VSDNPFVLKRLGVKNVPKNWEIKPLSKIVAEGKPIVYGIVQAGPHVEGGIPYIKSTDVNRPLVLDELQRTSVEIASKYKRSDVAPGDIVFSLRGNIGVSCIVPNSINLANLTQGTARLSVNGSNENTFVRHALSGLPVRRQIHAYGKGSTFKEISLEELRKLFILLPPLTEQQKIAAVLSTWDRAIELTEKLIAAKQKRKQALIHKLITEPLLTMRHRKPKSGWEDARLGTLIEKRTEKSSDLESFPLHSFTIANGVTAKTDRYERSFLLKDSENNEYALVRFEDFVVNPMNLRFGAIGRSRVHEPVTVSAYYDVFRVVSLECDGSFLEHVLKSPLLMHVYESVATGSLIEKKRVHFSEFVKISISLPSLDEQTHIAGMINVQDHEIRVLSEKTALLQRQKKGLMQQLLTGKVRVNVDSETAKG